MCYNLFIFFTFSVAGPLSSLFSVFSSILILLFQGWTWTSHSLRDILLLMNKTVCVCKHGLPLLRFSEALRYFWNYYPQSFHLEKGKLFTWSPNIFWIIKQKCQIAELSDFTICICLLLLTRIFRASCGGNALWQFLLHGVTPSVLPLLTFS